MYVLNVKSCMKIVPIDIHIFMPLSMTLIAFQGRNFMKNLKMKVVFRKAWCDRLQALCEWLFRRISGGAYVPCIYPHARWKLPKGDSGLCCCVPRCSCDVGRALLIPLVSLFVDFTYLLTHWLYLLVVWLALPTCWLTGFTCLLTDLFTDLSTDWLYVLVDWLLHILVDWLALPTCRLTGFVYLLTDGFTYLLSDCLFVLVDWLALHTCWLFLCTCWLIGFTYWSTDWLYVLVVWLALLTYRKTGFT